MDILKESKKSINPASKSTLEILGSLHHLSRDAAEGNLSHVLDAAVELPIRSFGVDKAILFHRSDIDDSYFPIASRNVSQSFLDNSHLLAKDSLNIVFSTRAPKVVEDIPSLSPDCAALFGMERVESFACIPVATQTSIKAALLYMRSTPVAFTVWEVELMCTIANHVAMALHFNHTDEIRTLSEIYPLLVNLRDTAFTSSELHRQLDAILKVVLTRLDADSGSIMLCEGTACRVAASQGLQGSFVPNLRIGDNGEVSKKVVIGRKPLLLHGSVDRDEFPGAVLRPDIVSAMSFPLKGHRKAIGLLNINSAKPGRLFTDNEFALAQSIAHHIAIALENAKLQEVERSQTRFLGNLYKIARTITSTLELDAVLDTIMERLRALIASEICALLLYNQDTGQLQLTSGYGIPGGTDKDYIDLVKPMIELSPKLRRSTVIRDLLHHSNYADSPIVQNLSLRSALLAPLTIKRKVVGYVAAYRCELRGFPPQVVRLLLGLAELAAIAIQNARLYERQMGIADLTYRELTPRQLHPVPGFDIGCKYSPAYQVGGDYYDIIKLDDHRYAVALADVSGKNVTAAAYIAMCKHSLRALAAHISSPAALLRRMNHLIYEQTEPEAFISMFYAVLDTKRQTITYASAGHPPAFLLRADTNHMEEIGTSCILLGIIPDATFSEKKASINVGDILVLYTDGLTDSLPQSQDGGFSAFEEVLTYSRLKNAQYIADNLHKLTLAAHTGRPPDDIALVVLKKT